MLRLIAVSLILVLGFGPCVRAAYADDVPIIETYELKKQRREARASARNPRSFWIRQVASRIEDKAIRLAMRLKAPVVVRVTFVVGHDGHLMSKAIATSSGNEAADKAALAMLDRAQPFPPMPTTMSDTDQTFTLPVRFR